MTIIGNEGKPEITLPKRNGVFKTILEEREERMNKD
jgi:hypothetical protein